MSRRAFDAAGGIAAAFFVGDDRETLAEAAVRSVRAASIGKA